MKSRRCCSPHFPLRLLIPFLITTFTSRDPALGVDPSLIGGSQSTTSEARGWEGVVTNKEFNVAKRRDVFRVIESYKNVSSDMLGRTNW